MAMAVRTSVGAFCKSRLAIFFIAVIVSIVSVLVFTMTARADEGEAFSASLTKSSDMQETGCVLDLYGKGSGGVTIVSASGGTVTQVTAHSSSAVKNSWTNINDGMTPIWPYLLGLEHGDSEYGSAKFYCFTSNAAAANNGAKNATFSVRYNKAGAIRDISTNTSVQVDIVSTWKIVESVDRGLLNSHAATINIGERFEWGAFNHNVRQHDQVLTFYKAGTNELYTLPSNIFVYQGSMDTGEGFSASDALSVQVSNDAPIVNPEYASASTYPDSYAGQGYIAAATPHYHFIPGTLLYELGDSDSDDGDKAFRGVMGGPGVEGLGYVDNVSDSSKTIYGHDYSNTYNWRAGAIEVAAAGKSSVKVRHYSVGSPTWPNSASTCVGVNDESSKVSQYRDVGTGVRDAENNLGVTYYSLALRPLTSYLPPKPYKDVDRYQTYRSEDTISYGVMQRLNKIGTNTELGNADYSYESFKFEDVLDSNVDYVANSFSVSLQGVGDITSKGTFSYNASTRTLTWTMNAAQCKNLKYEGGLIAFNFDVKVKPGAEASAEYVYNDARVYINGYELQSNQVRTWIVPPDPPVKSVDKTSAEVGETVNYTVVQEVVDGFVYNGLAFSDVVPSQVEYVDGSFYVLDKNGNNVTKRAGKLTYANNTLTYNFSSDWLDTAGEAAEKLTFGFKAKVLQSAANGEFVNEAVVNIHNGGYVLKSNEVKTETPCYYLVVQKRSAYAAVDNNNPAYSLAGARFSVTDSSGNSLGLLTTDANGRTETLTVYAAGQVTVTEFEPSPGHGLPDPAMKTVVLNQSNVGNTIVVEVTEPGIWLDLDVIAHKLDSDHYDMGTVEQDSSYAQGAASSLSGCKVRVDFYAGTTPSGNKLASAVFASDANGVVKFATGSTVDGTTWPYRYGGRNVLPLGCVTVTEVGAPDGYSIDPTVHVAVIVERNGEAVLVPVSNW